MGFRHRHGRGRVLGSAKKPVPPTKGNHPLLDALPHQPDFTFILTPNAQKLELELLSSVCLSFVMQAAQKQAMELSAKLELEDTCLKGEANYLQHKITRHLYVLFTVYNVMVPELEEGHPLGKMFAISCGAFPILIPVVFTKFPSAGFIARVTGQLTRLHARMVEYLKCLLQQVRDMRIGNPDDDGELKKASRTLRMLIRRLGRSTGKKRQQLYVQKFNPRGVKPAPSASAALAWTMITEFDEYDREQGVVNTEW